MLNYYLKPPLAKKITKQNKKTSFKFFLKLITSPLDQELINAVRAETKQAISTIYQVGYKNGKPYNDFPNDESKILSFLESFD